MKNLDGGGVVRVTLNVEWVSVMKIERFKEKDNKRKFIILFTVCCILLLAGVFLYTSFAVFTEEKEFNVINGQYQDPGDLYFAVYIDGEITNTFPSKDSGYTLDTEKSSCTNGATVSWDNDSWSALINLSNYSAGDMSRTKCTMHFIQDSTATSYIKNLANASDELVYDETSDNNLRYIGADPNNYVLFNNELWRIIGVMNNIDDGTGKKESRLKIVRNESIGFYSWDNVGGEFTNYNNDWSTSSLKGTLNNGPYWNRTSGECPDGSGSQTTSCDFSAIGLSSNAKTMIENAVWNLGGLSINEPTSQFYTKERSTEVLNGNSSKWTGVVGLIYPSDYGYATSGESITNREACLATELYHWSNVSYCYNNDWLYKSGTAQWTITHRLDYSVYVFGIDSDGSVAASISLTRAGALDPYGFGATTQQAAVFPSVYLSSDVKIIDGNGNYDNPFILSIEL